MPAFRICTTHLGTVGEETYDPIFSATTLTMFVTKEINQEQLFCLYTPEPST